MLRSLGYRFCLTLINIFFPPLTVMILTGLETDTLINSCLFLCGVIPSHIHGFYISCTYFHRRHKVRKGRYPGGPKSGIFSHKVINGGASDAEVDEIWRKERGLEKSKSGASKRSGGGGGGRSEPSRQATQMSQRQNSQKRDGGGRRKLNEGFKGFGNELNYQDSRGGCANDGGISGMDSRVGTGLDQMNSRMRRGGYDGVQSSPVSPQDHHWQ